jgi:small-conductance mechanosensitive channel
VERVLIPNEKIVISGIENIGRPHQHWLTQIGLTYDTPVIIVIEGILADHESMHSDCPPRIFFFGFNNWRLNISVPASNDMDPDLDPLWSCRYRFPFPYTLLGQWRPVSA